MPLLELVARFPLGVFQGRRSDGSTRDPFPDVARLHSALMTAAGKGSLALERDGDLRPADASLRALEWLDQHPPNAVQLPASTPVVTGGELVSYRSEGVFRTSGKQLKTHKPRKSLANRTAVAGSFGWQWEGAPEEVVDIVHQLAADVGCLGEADSPVVLEPAPVSPTHVRDVDALQIMSTVGVAIRCPEPGRTGALEAAYAAARPARAARDPKEGYRVNETAASMPAVIHARDHRYVEPGPVTPTTPWTSVLMFPLARTVPESDQLMWGVATHRMLAARLGDDAPSSITGRYPSGVVRPANRVAVQVLGSAAHLGHDGSAILVLVPHGLADGDRAQLMGVLARGARVRTRSGVETLRCVAQVRADEFWAAPASGMTRFWRPTPAMVAETRRQPNHRGRAWTLEEAAMLSLAFVFRDQLGPLPEGGGSQRYWAMVDAVRATGARAVNCHRISDTRVDRYAHRLPESLVAQPYDALIHVGALASPRTLVAMGQARHMGGGLLHPADVPHAVAEEVLA